MIIRSIMGCAALVSVVGLASVAQAQPLEKVTVSASFVGLWDTSQPSFCKERGEFEKAGLDVEVTSSRGGSETVQAVVAGGNDIGYSPGISSALAAYVQGAPIKIVSSEFVGQNDSYFYVKADSPIKSIDDLAGKTVAYPRPGGDTESVLLGLKNERNINFKPVATGGLSANSYHGHDRSGRCRIFVSSLPACGGQIGRNKNSLLWRCCQKHERCDRTGEHCQHGLRAKKA